MSRYRITPLAAASFCCAAAGSGVCLIACVVLAGWVLGVETLKSVSPGMIAMKVNTAVTFILAGTTLLLVRAESPRHPQQRAACLCAAAVALIGGLTLGEYLFGWDLGIDQLLFAELPGPAGAPEPGRMAPQAAASFLALGVALLVLDTRHGASMAQCLALGTGLTALVALIGYVYQVTALYVVGPYLGIALNTTLNFIILSVGILCVRPTRGMMALVVSESAGGVTVRRLLPVAIAAPVLLGLAIEGLGTPAGASASIYTVSLIVVFGVLVLWNGRLLHCSDLERTQAEQHVRQLNAELDQRVRERTANLSTAVTALEEEVAARQRVEERLRSAAAELARSNDQLQEFASIVSHDLQEPLRMVTSYVDLLARRYKSKLDTDADDFIAFAVDGTARMRRLIDDLLGYSRVGTRGKGFVLTNCEHVLASVLADLQESIATSGDVVTHDPLPTVMADDVQLGQVLQNLIANAIKLRGEAPPRVHVNAERHDDAWQFAVRDNGIGIDPQHFARIFVIFERLHARDAYAGTGVGLAICKRIVERHGGRIWVESAPGKGATFFFTIPDRTVGEVRR